jgi:hypothetical protein
VCKGVGLVVIFGRESEPLAVIEGSFDIENAEDRVVPGERFQTAVSRDLLGSAGVEVVEALVTDQDVFVGPECHPALYGLLAA